MGVLKRESKDTVQTQGNKQFLYSDKRQQLMRANRFLVIGYVVYYLYVMLMLVTSYSRGERSLGYCGMIGVMVLISLAVDLIIFKIKPDSNKLRYVSLIGLCLISWVISYAYTQDFASLIGVYPLVGCILFFDLRFSAVSAISYVLTIVLVNVTQMVVEKRPDVNFVDEMFVTSAVALLVVLICFTTRIARLFNNDSVNAAAAEQARQKEIMDDVLTVADEVRKGT